MVPFYEMFDCCKGETLVSGLLETAKVAGATVDRKNAAMKVTLHLEKPAAPVELRLIEAALASAYGLSAVTVLPVYPRAKPTPKPGGKKPGARTGEVIMGRQIRGRPVAMEGLTLDSGNVIVAGEVVDVTTREIMKIKAVVLSFDITDYTSTIRVSKFMRDPGSDKIAERVKKGMSLTVSGTMSYDRFYGDLTLDPKNIVVGEKERRMDAAEEKRVELHMHTRMSMMDALSDPKDIVKRAIEWGHPAVAITDHGVVQSFPDAMSAAGDKIKVLYGVEGYYVNDVDDKVPVYGNMAGSLEDEYVVFDIETTGLSAMDDAITEIGAVVMRGGEELDRFHTFADPKRPISAEITRLTGITDADVAGAPGEAEAVRAFLAFVGGRRLAAHNASFDVGFIYEVCERHGIPFTPAFLDTLALARALLPDLRRHSLDVVAGFLGTPEFRHHRATDDAVTTGLVLAKLLDRLKAAGVSDASEINDYILRHHSVMPKKGRYRPRHIIIFARTQAGMKNLYTLITKSHLEHFSKPNPIIPKSLIMQYREGLLIGSACEAGEVFRLVSEGRSRFEQRRIGAFYDYLEIQPICNNAFMLRGERPKAKNEETLRDFNRRIVALGRDLGKPVCATGDVHFLDPEDEIYRHVLLTAKEFSDADSALPIYFKTTEEMLAEFSYLGPETAREVVIENPNKIAGMCDVVRPLPPAKTLFAPKIENSAEDLKALVYGRMRELYGENPPEIITRRVETELRDILDRGYDVIYMSAQKLVADSLKNGYIVGSRGSVGSSIVAYLSGVTEVNSLPAHYRCPRCKHTDFESGQGWGCGADMPEAACPECGEEYAKEGFDIPFETFLGFGGDKVPDIDLNFSGEYQARAHKYTNELFGAENVFKAGTIGTVAEKTAYGYVKKYLEKIGKTVPKAEENRLAQGCVGVKRTTGQHPGGLIVIPRDMDMNEFCPTQYPADDDGSGIITTHFDYHKMEDNLLKLDELGHDDPTMLKMLEDLTGVDVTKIRLDDEETMDIFSSPAPLGLPEDDEIIGGTGTIGIPEFGTGFTRQMLCDTRPDKYDTLVRLSGFSHGTDVWLGNAKDIILNGIGTIDETIGCRDDIMLFLISKGMDEKFAFKIMESVRKGRGLPDGAEAQMKELGVPEWYIESCKKIKYLFPKAHAVAYVMMAFRIAWFKVHEPLAFYSAYFYRRSQKDAFDAAIMTRGIELVKSKIREITGTEKPTAKEQDLLTTLEACYEFYLRGFTFQSIDLYKSDPVKFNVEGNGLLPPFVAVSGLGEVAAYDLAEHRSDREYVSIEDLASVCTKLSKAHIEQLQNLGALGALPETSQLSLF